jgi:hypothetical protein
LPRKGSRISTRAPTGCPPLEREIERLERKIEKLERRACKQLSRLVSADNSTGFGMAHVAMQVSIGSGPFKPGSDPSKVDIRDLEEWIPGRSRSGRGTVMKPKTQFELPDLRALDQLCRSNPLRDAAKTAYTQAVKDRNAAIKALGTAQQSFMTSVKAFHDAIQQAWDIKKQVDNAASDLHFYLNKGENKFVAKTVVVKWIGEIEDAMDSYFEANVRSIHPDLLAKDPKPLETWVMTDALKLIGTPPPIADNLATLKFELGEFRKKVNQIDPVLSVIGPKLDAIQLQIESQLKLAARKALLEELKRAKDIDANKLLDLMEKESIESKLEKVFRSGGERNLLAIPDIAERVRRDWGVTAGKKQFSRDSAAFRDAVTLAKLSLLDCNGLNELARQLGVARSSYADGNPLYPDDPRAVAYPVMIDGLECFPPVSDEPTWAPCNIFRNWLRSIDGNHQWRSDSPRYARARGAHAKPRQEFVYQRTRRNPGAGLRIWEDSAARDAIFRKLFTGPVSAAFEAPQELVPPLRSVVPPGFKYRGCGEDPFPDQYPSPKCE